VAAVLAAIGPSETTIVAIVLAVTFLATGLFFIYLGWPSRREPSHGERAKATILSLEREQGDFAGRPVVKFTLEVRPKGGVPFQVTTKSITQGGFMRLERGGTLPVLLDPVDPEHVEIDWASA
jgi:hypothetical protein